MAVDRLRSCPPFVAVALALAACSGSAAPVGPDATPEPPAPTPTPHPWVIDVTSAKATTKTFVGGEMVITLKLENTGKSRSNSTQFQLSEIEDYADVVGCTPECDIDRGLGGGYYLELPGVGAGKERTFKIELVPTKVGAAHWDVCVYDDAEFGDQIACYEGTVTIR